MKSLLKKSFGILLTCCLILTVLQIPVFAAEDQTKNLGDQDAAFLQMMSEPGVILSSSDKTVEIKLTKDFIDKNKEQLSDSVIASGVAIVQVHWRIGYNSADGLCFYTRADSEDLGCLIKSIVGDNEYRDLGSYASGSVEIRTTNTVPTYAINDFHATNRYFLAGTVLECSMWCDVDALNEISGGSASFSDTVTIPQL